MLRALVLLILAFPLAAMQQDSFTVTKPSPLPKGPLRRLTGKELKSFLVGMTIKADVATPPEWLSFNPDGTLIIVNSWGEHLSNYAILDDRYCQGKGLDYCISVYWDRQSKTYWTANPLADPKKNSARIVGRWTIRR